MKIGLSLTGIGQQPSGTNMFEHYQQILEYVRIGRDLGFDFIYQGQHYLTEPYQQLQTIPLLSRLSAEAGDMEIVATLLIPLQLPIDLAEQMATLDIMTGGKFIVAGALGYRDVEYNAFNVNPKFRVSRYMECINIVKQLWTGNPVTFHGKHFQMDNARMVLKPITQPNPPFWLAANSDSAIERAAKNDLTWYVNPHANFPTIKRQIELYKTTANEAGSTVPDNLPMGRELFVHRDREEAMKIAAPFLGGKYDAYAKWGQDKALPADDKFADSFEELAKDRFIIGNPEDCATELKRYVDLGIDQISLRMCWPGMPVSEGIKAMETFADTVMPILRRGG
jgi:alkanesulfonate monooxygenase SsuD/methylene tetrahydromethanopterin reductase-like flavin-dependent oxidoreductase (luciferase family)